MSHIYGGRCGRHTVHCGWQKRVAGITSFPKEHSGFYREMCNLIKNWMYSWMKDKCESQEEYSLSKNLFLKFIGSTYITDKLTIKFTESVTDFFRKYVEIYEGFYLFHLRKHIRHYGEYTTNPQEGVHRGMKHHGAPVTPN